MCLGWWRGDAAMTCARTARWCLYIIANWYCVCINARICISHLYLYIYIFIYYMALTHLAYIWLLYISHRFYRFIVFCFLFVYVSFFRYIYLSFLYKPLYWRQGEFSLSLHLTFLVFQSILVHNILLRRLELFSNSRRFFKFILYVNETNILMYIVCTSDFSKYLEK